MKTVRILLLVTVLLAGMVVGVSASSPYYSYTYSYQSDGSVTDIAAPLPYLPEALTLILDARGGHSLHDLGLIENKDGGGNDQHQHTHRLRSAHQHDAAAGDLSQCVG